VDGCELDDDATILDDFLYVRPRVGITDPLTVHWDRARFYAAPRQRRMRQAAFVSED